MIALAEILVKSDIAVPEDWEKSERDATKYLLLTLRRWIRMHGGSAIDRRFDLDLSLSDRLVDYSDQRGPEGSFYLIVDPDSAAFVLLTPTIELLEKVHPRLPATFYSHFAGALNRWVRVYDYRDAEERVEMLREWYEGEENADQYEIPDVEGCTPKSLKETPLNPCELKKLNEEVRDHAIASSDQRSAGIVSGIETGQAPGVHRGHGGTADGLESSLALSARSLFIG